ncbi:thiamine diphosphokinase [Caldicellulosiruptoraceae bacterium PP1]
MKGVIISNGKKEGKDFYLSEIKDSNFLICCDGGLNIAYMYELIPNLIIGDFDSVDSIALEYYKKKNVPIMQFDKEKDKTDTQIAVEYLLAEKFDNVVMLSCTGSRIDHTMANISLLYKIIDNNAFGCIKDSNNIIYLVKKEIALRNLKGRIISLLPFTQYVEGINSKGLYYPLNNSAMEFGNPYGISNIIMENEAKIELKKGLLLAIISND